MAKGSFKIPKGARVSKETLKLIGSAAFLSRVKKRKEMVTRSVVTAGYFPEDGNVSYRVVGFNVTEARKDRGQGDVYADNWDVYFKVHDSAHKDDGKEFTKRFRLFLPDLKKKKDKDREDFSVDAGEMKLLLEAGLDQEEKAGGEGARWAEILCLLIKEEMVLRGRAWTTERTDEGTSRKYTDHHLRTFGIVGDDEEEPGTVGEEESGEDEDEDEGEDEKGEEGEESNEDEEEGEGDESDVEIEVGMELNVTHPKRDEEVQVKVRSIDEDEQTFVGSYKKGKKSYKATFKFDAIQSAVSESDEDSEDEDEE